jgi:hypothetical protein
MEHCGQEQTIGEIKATLSFFQSAEERREAREERMLKAMEDIAAQGATLISLSERTAKNEKDISEAFGVIRMLDQSAVTKVEHKKLEDGHDALALRVNHLEIKAEGEKVKVGFIVAFISVICSGVTALVIKIMK